ncbi:MAG: hypothetical protein ABI597_07370 [Gammaproteobacteria bacterium]
MLNTQFNNFIKKLPRFIPGFPVILKTQSDIFQAEKSGDLSFGMLDAPDQPKLPVKIRYIVSLLYEHPDASSQNLFFSFQEKTSHPFSAERQAARKDTWEKLNAVLQQLKMMDEKSSALLKYMNSLDGKQKNIDMLESQARIELINMVLHQWNDTIHVDSKYLVCLDVFMNAKKNVLKSIFFPDRKKFAEAKKYMELQVNGDPLLYHHAWGIGITLWNGIRKLHDEMDKPEFKRMVENGNWSPASFLVQHKIAPKSEFRVTTRPTTLGGVLSYQLGHGKFVILSSRDAAKDANGLFLGVCCASTFIMDLLSLLVSNRMGYAINLPPLCPYKNTIQNPLY